MPQHAHAAGDDTLPRNVFELSGAGARGKHRAQELHGFGTRTVNAHSVLRVANA